MSQETEFRYGFVRRRCEVRTGAGERESEPATAGTRPGRLVFPSRLVPLRRGGGVDESRCPWWWLTKCRLGRNGACTLYWSPLRTVSLLLSRKDTTHTFKSQFNSSLKLIKKIDCTSSEDVLPVIGCYESTKSENSSV